MTLTLYGALAGGVLFAVDSGGRRSRGKVCPPEDVGISFGHN